MCANGGFEDACCSALSSHQVDMTNPRYFEISKRGSVGLLVHDLIKPHRSTSYVCKVLLVGFIPRLEPLSSLCGTICSARVFCLTRARIPSNLDDVLITERATIYCARSDTSSHLAVGRLIERSKTRVRSDFPIPFLFLHHVSLRSHHDIPIHLDIEVACPETLSSLLVRATIDFLFYRTPNTIHDSPSPYLEYSSVHVKRVAAHGQACVNPRQRARGSLRNVS